MAKRAEEFHRREQALRQIVAEYFGASEQAEKARSAAHAKADKIRAQADERVAGIHAQGESSASQHERRADAAISRMLELGEQPKAVAETLAIPLTRVREIQRPTPRHPDEA